MVTNLSDFNSLIAHWLCELRDTRVQHDRLRFRTNLERIGEVMGYELSKTLKYEEKNVTTPLGIATGQTLTVQPVIVPIMRAGLSLHKGLLRYFDNADSGFIGSFRHHQPDDPQNPQDHCFEIEQHYLTAPPLAGRPLIVADPMLATGASSTVALAALLESENPSEVHLVCVIASEDGIKTVKDKFPNVHIWTAAIDQGLTDQAYIIPGIGDAGDLSFGQKKQV